MRNKKGFTLVELIIVIVIVGILTIIATVAYRDHVRRSMATEGKALLSAVANAKRIYVARHGYFVNVAETSDCTMLHVDARWNRYFTSFSVTNATTDSFTATTHGSAEATGSTVWVNVNLYQPTEVMRVSWQ